MKLSPGQQSVFDKIMRWIQTRDQEFVLGGYAGTGKSTLAATIAAAIGEDLVYYGAYTGKAANVLREKGCENAKTIHGWLYDPVDWNPEVLKKLEQKLESAMNRGDEAEAKRMQDKIDDLRRKMKRPKFELNMDSPLKKAKLVIVDEFSMLPDKILDDLRKVAKKILFIGDPYQLPPVEGECSLVPDAFLEEIHRQAMGSAIIAYSKEVREGGYIPHGRHGDLDFLRRGEAGRDIFLEADQVICGRNNTRVAMNDWFRKEAGIDAMYPVRGEKLICLKNNHAMGLFNGMIVNAASDAAYAGYMCHIDIEDMQRYKVFSGDFIGGGEFYDFKNPAHKELERFTYAYCITAHKSQGSEFGNLTVINEPIGKGEMRRRWLYTALTRAKQHCTLIDGGVR